MTEKRSFNSNDFANVGNSLMNKDWDYIPNCKHMTEYPTYVEQFLKEEWWHIYVPNYLDEPLWIATARIYDEEEEEEDYCDKMERFYQFPSPEKFREEQEQYKYQYEQEVGTDVIPTVKNELRNATAGEFEIGFYL